MDTHRLKQFCVVAETGSITDAAKLLHISHSGLSKSLKLLQEELQCKLLRPSGRGLSLTDDGLRIYRDAKEFLKHEERLFHNREKSRPSPSLRIGCCAIFLKSMATQLRELAFENRMISLFHFDPGKMEQMIANRELDFGITYAPCPLNNIDIIEIGEYRLGCYHLKGHFDNTLFADLPFVVPATSLADNPFGIKERDGWFESIYPRKMAYCVNRFSTGIELTLLGLCAIYMPEFMAKIINKERNIESLVEFPLPENKINTQRIFLLKHKDTIADNISNKIHKMVKNIIL